MKTPESYKLLGIDIGTTSLKAAVFDGTGKRLAVRSVDYTLDTDAETGFIEFNADEYITMCRRVISELEAECGTLALGKRIADLIGAHARTGEGVILKIDATGKQLLQSFHDL